MNYGIDDSEKIAINKLKKILKKEGYELNENMIAQIKNISGYFVKNGLNPRKYRIKIENEQGKEENVVINFYYQRYRLRTRNGVRGSEKNTEFVYLPYSRKR